MKRWCRVAAALALVLIARSALGAERPRLVVLLAVDQMRADYFEWYGSAWKSGLHRLFTQGAWFTQARYPYLNTITCPGHATLGTGAYPHRHGMILNTWYDRQSKKVVECTDDPETPLIVYGRGSYQRGDSGKSLMIPTLADEMQAQLTPRPRVAAFSSKARAAISLGGHKPDVVLWFEGSNWVTSTAFAAAPTPWVERVIAANPLAALADTAWTRLLAPSAYKNEDDAEGEKPPVGWSRAFPHPLKPATQAPGVGRFANSPAADDYLGRLARASLTEMKLGAGPGTDFLAVSFSMTDIVGHQFGPLSHEVQDVLARLDATIGQLLDALDAQVGRGRYVVALSADHGVAFLPEQSKAAGKDAGRISQGALKQAAQDAVTAELGPAPTPYAVEVQTHEIYLAPGVHDRLAEKSGAIPRVLAALRTVRGVADAMDASEITDPATAKDALRKAAALSYYPGRSGDLFVAPKLDWTMGTLGTNHGTIYDYDQRVPVLFFGKGIKPGKYNRAASPADIVPTLARLVGVKVTRAEGAVLPEVVGAGATSRAARKAKKK